MINNYEREKIRFSQEISNLKNDILSLSTQLNDKNSQCKNITDKVANLEQMIKEKDENFSKTNQELLVIVISFNYKMFSLKKAILSRLSTREICFEGKLIKNFEFSILHQY